MVFAKFIDYKFRIQNLLQYLELLILKNFTFLKERGMHFTKKSQ